MKLNPTQHRHLRDSLAHLDRHLGAIEAILAPAAGSVFPRHCHDLSDAERHEQTEAVARVRAALRRVMAEHEIAPEAPPSARQALQSQWSLAEIGLEELAPRSMRGYGEVDDAQAQMLERLAAGLQAELAAARQGEASGSAARQDDLHEMLAQATPLAMTAMAQALAEAVLAGRSNDELPLIAGDALARAAAEQCAAHGLAVPARPLDIDGIAWRLDKPRLAGLGRDYLVGRFAKQLAPLEQQVRTSLRAWGHQG